MSDDAIDSDLMDYAGLMQQALRGVIRQALKKAASPEGLPGDHHFYITFLTQAEGVSLPDEVRAQYPHDITIVLQHQFRELKIFEDVFNVTLSFGGIPRVLRVPYSAITRFYDPAVQFVLEFVIDETLAQNDDDSEADSDFDIVAEAEDAAKDAAGDTPKVVSLEQFRKK